MKYGTDVHEDVRNDFYFPTDNTFELFASDDININRLVELARFLLEKRDEAWEHV